jgi:hypothetical protein
MEVIKVSQSRVKLRQKCRQAHYYKYNEKLERKIKSRPLQFGSIMHEMLETQANKENPFEALEKIEAEQGQLFREQREELGDILDTAQIIFEAYQEHYKDDPIKYLKLNGQFSEHELEVEIADGIVLVMKLDGIIKTPNKLRWLLEHKTFKSLPGDDDRWRNIQVAVYFKGCDLLGMRPFDGVCWNYVRSKEPTRPAINQDGSMSRRKIDTLPAVVRQVAEDNEIKPNKILLAHSESRIDTWFQRIYTPVSPQVIDLIFDDFLRTSFDIAEFPNRKERNIDKHCGWCDFEAICRAELTGGDPDFVKEREYDKRKSKKKKSQKKKKPGRG